MKGIIDKIGKAIGEIGDAADKNFTSKEEKLEHYAKIQELMVGLQRQLMNIKQSIILAEVNGNKLQRNWRPILMLAFGFVVVYDSVAAPLLTYYWHVPRFALAPEFWETIKLSMGGYVIGRSAEKVVPPVAGSVKQMLGRK